MIFDINIRSDDFIEKLYAEAVKELDEFYKVKLTKPTFKVCIEAWAKSYSSGCI